MTLADVLRDVVIVVDDVGVVALTAAQYVDVADAPVERVVAAIAEELVKTAKALKHIRRIVAVDDVVEAVAGRIEGAVAGQRDVLDVDQVDLPALVRVMLAEMKSRS